MNKKGFTLIEVLATIIILGILASITTIAVSKIYKRQKQKNEENKIVSLLTGVREYCADNPSDCSEDVLDIKSESNFQNYVDEDVYKFYSSELNKTKVCFETCSNNNKRKIKTEKINLNGILKEYNDCGCEQQTSGDGQKLCTD